MFFLIFFCFRIRPGFDPPGRLAAAGSLSATNYPAALTSATARLAAAASNRESEAMVTN